MRDYWNISKRNFRALAVLIILAIIFVGFAAAQTPASAQAPILTILGFLIVTCVFFFILAHLFSKRSPAAVKTFYVYLVIWVLLQLVPVLLNPSLITTNWLEYIFSILLMLYIWDCVRRASKQGPAPQTPQQI